MKIENIIEDLVSHSISKQKAIRELRKITNGLISDSAIECNVVEVAFTVDSNDGILKLRIPYGYRKIEGKVMKGDIINIIITP